MTPEYIQRAGWEWIGRDGHWGWVDPDVEGAWMLPTLRHDGFSVTAGAWAGFAGTLGNVFLDHQYIYDAHCFNDLSGGRWKTFRRNIKKWPKRNTTRHWQYARLNNYELDDRVCDLLETWVAGRDDLQDPEVLVDFVLHGSIRWGLFCENELVGLNVGDDGVDVGVYRYCIDNGEPFLNEFLRWCFYIHPWAQERRWINDGGDLGNKNLERFKTKLNPAKVLDVYSFTTQGRDLI